MESLLKGLWQGISVSVAGSARLFLPSPDAVDDWREEDGEPRSSDLVVQHGVPQQEVDVPVHGGVGEGVDFLWTEEIGEFLRFKNYETVKVGRRAHRLSL